MKICLLTYRGNMYCGGQGIYVYYLAKALHGLGHEVHVMAGPPYPSVPEGVKLHELEGLNLYETQALSSLRDPFRIFDPINFYEVVATHVGMFPEIFTFSMRAYFKLRELAPTVKFDVVHDNQTLGYGLLMMRSMGVPVVATIHHPIPIDMKADLAQARKFMSKFRRIIFYSFLIMQNIVSPRMDRVITVSESSAKDTARIFHVPMSKIRVVHNGIDTDVFKKIDHVKREPNNIIMVGNTEDRKKGVIFLLQAMRMLKEEQCDVKLTIVDRKGDHTKYAPKLIHEFNLEDRVTFTGRLSTEELVRHYSAAEVAVTASVYEGFGLPCAEAMSCSTPVIATKAGALPEVVNHGRAGLLVPPEDPSALAAAIKQLLSNQSLRQRLGEAGRKRIEEAFSWEDAAKKTLEVYKEVV
jgi:glycosyltransferase involved in cell wall biosynthesis